MWVVEDKKEVHEPVIGDSKEVIATTDQVKASKKARRLAKRKGERNVNGVNAEDEEWARISTQAPPPLPNETKASNSPGMSSKKSKKRKGGAVDGREAMNAYSVDDWDWSEVQYPQGMLLTDDLGGFLCLEEVDDIAVDYVGDDKTGKQIQFSKVKSNKKRKSEGHKATPETPLSIEETKDYYDVDTYNEESAAADQAARQAEEAYSEEEQEPAANGQTEKKESKKTKDKIDNKSNSQNANGKLTKVEEEVDTDFDISAWDQFKLAETVRRALQKQKFGEPTPIQAATLPSALEGRDIIGTAETGSGKTLAFGLPMINDLATAKKLTAEGLLGLVLTPTRELAMQVTDHIAAAAAFTECSVAAIVGGMSVHKQQRLLRQNPNIIVATPGRFWEIFSENEEYLEQLKNIKYLVLDEADRMLERGHFKELGHILDMLSSRRRKNQKEDASNDDVAFSRQTFIFTATLNNDIRYDVKKKWKQMDGKKETASMEELLKRIEFSDPSPVRVDLTSSSTLPSTLQESKIDCLANQKDAYVYYFCTRYPGRTLIFVNSIDSIRRLTPTFALLGMEVLGLHAQMQQRQRLKNLDRFKANPRAVLVASDVAARGLDVPFVEAVIHYQLPRSGEIYVHRSGRTARAGSEGVSLLLVAPEEVKQYRKLCNVFRGGKPYPDFPIDRSILAKLKQRVELATKIDKEEHQAQKETHDSNWMQKTAEALGVDVDADMEVDPDAPDSTTTSSKKKKMSPKMMAWKEQLKQMIKEPLLQQGASAKYLTSGSIRDLAATLLEANRDGADKNLLPGLKQERAVDAVRPKKKQKP